MLTPSRTVRHFGQLAILSGVFGLLGSVCPVAAHAADLSLPITGNLIGSVMDSGGIPQMGATVQLLNKYKQTVAKVTSDVNGHFLFASLPVDLYSLRASLPSFLPVSRDQVAVKAGVDSVLQIHLATLISSVEVSYIVPAAAMNDDWKWVLRSSAATRPVNRYLPDTLGSQNGPGAESEDGSSARTPIFSETHAFVSVTGGDGGALDSDSSFSDFGTAFALSTQVFGKNHVQVSGSFGDSSLSASPTVAVSAIYSRGSETSFGGPPEITFSAVQIAGIGSANPASLTGIAGNGSIPLRSLSIGLYEAIDPLPGVHLEYGATGESVDYAQHTSRLSPFARLSVDTGRQSQVVMAFSDGGRPDLLLRHSSESSIHDGEEDDFGSSLGSLQRLPQISSRQSRLVLQRTQSMELGYTKHFGSRTISLSGFSEDVTNGRLSVAGDFSSDLAPNILSDTLSRTSVYNIGRYRRNGYLGSVSQHLGSRLEVGLAYGRMGAFGSQFLGSTGGLLRQQMSGFASARLQTTLPHIGTKIDADYGWMDSGTVIPRHTFTTQGSTAAPGLNVYLRQPVPTFFGLPGRLELTADMRNLLSQGYLPLATPEGRQMLIVQAPQSVRGGLNFTF